MRKKEDELAEEIAGHERMAARDGKRNDLGNVTRVKERVRAEWSWPGFSTIGQDIRYSLRIIRRHPVFTATAVLSLALGIGANTAIYSILNAVVLRSLPVRAPNELVQVTSSVTGPEGEFTYPIWEQIRDRQTALSGVLGYAAENFDLSEDGQKRPASGIWVSGDFFNVLGVRASLGRVFSKPDDVRGGAPVAVISESFRRRNFPGENPAGRMLRINRQAFRIIGVTPKAFAGLEAGKQFDVAIPFGAEPLVRGADSVLGERLAWWIRILGRVDASPGSLPRAEGQMRAISESVFQAAVPGIFDAKRQAEFVGSTFRLVPAPNGFGGSAAGYKPALFALMSIAGVVLLIACANIAGLLLARGKARRRELSVRMAIGASRGRLIRQLLTESFVLAGLGAATGFVLSLWGAATLAKLISTPRLPFDANLSPDWSLLLFTVSVTMVTAVLFGLLPAVNATRTDLNQSLKQGARTMLKMRGLTLRGALVAGQVALSLVLVAGAGLFLSTLRNLLSADMGFDPHQVIALTVEVPQSDHAPDWNALQSGIAAVPGVTSVGTEAITPLSGNGWNNAIHVEGFVPQTRRDELVYFNRASPGYFRTMRMRLIGGRDFMDRDDRRSEAVMILSQSTARQFFGGKNPIGGIVGVAHPGKGGPDDLYHVVGVVADAAYRSVTDTGTKTVWLASGQDKARNFVHMEVRYSGSMDAVIPGIRAAVLSAQPEASFDPKSLEREIRDSLRQNRLVAILSGVFGALALVLAMVGLYGVIDYAVARRRNEIGVRIALGARRNSVVLMMLRDAAFVQVTGIAAGIAISLAAGKLIAGLLFGVKANSPAQLAMAATVLAVCTMVAAYLPAWRASRLDPMKALREE